MRMCDLTEQQARELYDAVRGTEYRQFWLETVRTLHIETVRRNLFHAYVMREYVPKLIPSHPNRDSIDYRPLLDLSAGFQLVYWDNTNNIKRLNCDLDLAFPGSYRQLMANSQHPAMIRARITLADLLLMTLADADIWSLRYHDDDESGESKYVTTHTMTRQLWQLPTLGDNPSPSLTHAITEKTHPYMVGKTMGDVFDIRTNEHLHQRFLEIQRKVEDFATQFLRGFAAFMDERSRYEPTDFEFWWDHVSATKMSVSDVRSWTSQ